jgi:hypothetical protein
VFIAGGIADQIAAEFLADGVEALTGEWAVGDFAVVAGEPGFADLFFAFVVGIDRAEVEGAPGAGVELGRHEEWVEGIHSRAQIISKERRDSGNPGDSS